MDLFEYCLVILGFASRIETFRLLAKREQAPVAASVGNIDFRRPMRVLRNDTEYRLPRDSRLHNALTESKFLFSPILGFTRINP
jgi:hypothetical protein